MKLNAVLLTSLWVLLSVPNWAHTKSVDEIPSITVSGEATVNVFPDKILINFGIETWDKEIMLAKKENNEILKKAVATLQKLGVKKDAIQTNHLSIEPRWNSDYRKEEFIGYFVRNSFYVTVTEVESVEEIVSMALVSGVTNIHHVDFQTSELKKYREQARELALLAAKEKAQKMAATLDQRIATPLQISETYSGSSGLYWSNWSFDRNTNYRSQNVIQDIAGGSSSGDTLSLGKIPVRASVSVTFELKR